MQLLIRLTVKTKRIQKPMTLFFASKALTLEVEVGRIPTGAHALIFAWRRISWSNHAWRWRTRSWCWPVHLIFACLTTEDLICGVLIPCGRVTFQIGHRAAGFVEAFLFPLVDVNLKNIIITGGCRFQHILEFSVLSVILEFFCLNGYQSQHNENLMQYNTIIRSIK